MKGTFRTRIPWRITSELTEGEYAVDDERPVEDEPCFFISMVKREVGVDGRDTVRRSGGEEDTMKDPEQRNQITS